MAGDRVLLRWLPTSQLDGAAQRALWPMLSSEEQSRAERFAFDEDRRCFIAAHALTRALLAEHAGRSPQSWRFQLGEFGKPKPILAPDEPDLRVNLSHTKGMAIAALGIGRDIGVDVERLDRRAPIEVADRYFTSEEQAFLKALRGRELSEGFFALWTLKEAYMKATGRGLDLPLSSFAFQIDPPKLLFSIEDAQFSRWRFERRTIEADHIAALAVEAGGEEIKAEAASMTADQVIALSAHLGGA